MNIQGKKKNSNQCPVRNTQNENNLPNNYKHALVATVH